MRSLAPEWGFLYLFLNQVRRPSGKRGISLVFKNQVREPVAEWGISEKNFPLLPGSVVQTAKEINLPQSRGNQNQKAGRKPHVRRCLRNLIKKMLHLPRVKTSWRTKFEIDFEKPHGPRALRT